MSKTKLFIHAGTHKTATTAFQSICQRKKNNLLLERSGIYYPRIKKKVHDITLVYSQHSLIARSLSSINIQYAVDFFLRVSKELQGKDIHTLLMSGEDFENILIDYRLFENLLKTIESAGFQSPIISFTTRDPYEYFSSMYAELSKKKVLIDFYQAALSASKTGFFSCPTGDGFQENLSFNNFFALDAKELISRFKGRFPGISVRQESLDSFTNPSVGYNLLSELLHASQLNLVDFNFISDEQNERLDIAEVEMNYSRTFLGLEKGAISQMLVDISNRRVEKRIESECLVKNLFKHSFY